MSNERNLIFMKYTKILLLIIALLFLSAKTAPAWTVEDFPPSVGTHGGTYMMTIRIAVPAAPTLVQTLIDNSTSKDVNYAIVSKALITADDNNTRIILGTIIADDNNTGHMSSRTSFGWIELEGATLLRTRLVRAAPLTASYVQVTLFFRRNI